MLENKSFSLHSWFGQFVLFFYSYKKFTTSFTYYYTYLATIQYYRDDAKGSEGQRLPQSLNIKTRNYTLHTTNCTPHTVQGQRILYLILFHIGCQIGVGKKFKKSHECRLFVGSSWVKSDIQYEQIYKGKRNNIYAKELGGCFVHILIKPTGFVDKFDSKLKNSFVSVIREVFITIQ